MNPVKKTSSSGKSTGMFYGKLKNFFLDIIDVNK